jgi:hypothetical protein
MNQFNRVKLLVFPIFLFLSSFTFSQGKLSVHQLNESWQLLDESKGVKIFAKKQQCVLTEGQLPLEYVFLKLENSNNSVVEISYSLGSLFKEGCVHCEPNSEMDLKQSLSAGETVTATCELPLKGLHALIDNPNLKKGWDFEAVLINNLKVTSK